MDCREATELRGVMEIVSGLVCEVERAEGQESNSFRRLEILRGVRLKSHAGRRLTIEVNIQTAETYVIYKSYICMGKPKGQVNGESN